MIGAIFDQKALVERNSIVPTPLVGAIQRFPVHFALLDESNRFIEEYSRIRESGNLIKSAEGHYPLTSLANFDFADQDVSIETFPPASWEEVRTFFVQEIRRIGHKWFEG
jgi:hypothetical protein